jgi:replicative DNA helicase
VDDAESYLLSAEGRIRDVVAAAEDGNAKSTTTMFDASRSFVKKLFDMATTPAKRGLRTGIGPLDDILLPMQPAQMIIVAARTGVGKTSFALNLADACVGGAGGSERGGALFFTAEMTREQLALRAISARTKIDGTRLAAGYTTDEDWPKLQAAIDGMRHLPLWVNDESDLTISIIRQQIRAVKAEIKQRNMVDEETGEPVKLRMVVVDYLQLLGSDDAPGNKNSNREQEVARLSRGLKRISKSESLTVIALSQLSRKVEDRASKKPMLSDLRESGSIEQDADSILFLYRDDYYDNETANKDTAEIIVAKQRGGKTGTAVVGFDRGLTQFHSGQFRLPGFVRDLAARQSTQCRE